jgi:hypothetical protein
MCAAKHRDAPKQVQQLTLLAATHFTIFGTRVNAKGRMSAGMTSCAGGQRCLE